MFSSSLISKLSIVQRMLFFKKKKNKYKVKMRRNLACILGIQVFRVHTLNVMVMGE